MVYVDGDGMYTTKSRGVLVTVICYCALLIIGLEKENQLSKL